MSVYPDIFFKKSQLKYDWFELIEDCQVVSITGQTFVLPKGFSTDFASVWQGLWWFLPPHGRMANASVVHDYWYENRLFANEIGDNLARHLADLDFLGRCLEAETPRWQALLAYRFLRVFGASFWYQKNKRQF